MSDLRRVRIPIICAALGCLLLSGCESVRITLSTFPSQPRAQSPPDGATDYAAVVSFSWESTDPQGGILEFDFYFGAQEDPPLHAAALSDPEYYLPSLQPSTRYYWRVVARDADGNESASKTWSFRTWASPAFPLAVGNRWEFSGVYYSVESGERPEPGNYQNVILYSTTWEIIDSLISPSGELVYVLESRTMGMPGDYFPVRYHVQNTPEGLYWSNAWFPQSEKSESDLSSASLVRANGAIPSSFAAGLPAPGLEYGPPQPLIPYPLKVGTEWVYSELVEGFRVMKRVSAQEWVETEDGRRRCYVIETWYDYPPRQPELKLAVLSTFRDYVCELGIVKRTWSQYGDRVPTYSDPYGNAPMDTRTELTVQEATLIGLP